MYDICIIGAGIIGSAIARELAKYDLNICLLEKNEDVATETTKANSGIVHGGYDAKHGTMKAKFSALGNSMYQQLDNELNFGFSQLGSFVIGFNEADALKIQEIYANGLKNGAQALKIVDGDFVREREPNLSKDITVALYCATAGVTSPFEFAIALAENAIENGVELKLNTKVTNIEKCKDHFLITTNESIAAKLVINAAGLYADEIAQMVGLNDFTIKPRQGQYLLFDKDQGDVVNGVIFQTPSPVSKGVLVTKTQHGNLLIGPTAEDVSAKDDLDITKEGIDFIVEAAKKSLPQFDMRKVITSFSGNRAAASTHDFIIEETKVKGFINAAGIESPGLTSAPAIALKVTEIVEETLTLKKKANFNPKRKPYQKNGRIICRCETVSEGEILDALSRGIPINSLDAIKRRSRAGMGRCQGGFCAPRIMEIILKRLNN